MSDGVPLRLEIHSTVLHLALSRVADAAGYELVSNLATPVMLVSDRLPINGPHLSVFVAEPTAVHSTIALGSLLIGQVGSVISAAEPEQLVGAVNSILRNMASLPQALLVASKELPELTRRQHAILSCLANGGSGDRAIAQAAGSSIPTVKRDLRLLYDIALAAGRNELAGWARRLGYSGPLGEQALRLLSVCRRDGAAWATPTMAPVPGGLTV